MMRRNKNKRSIKSALFVSVSAGAMNLGGMALAQSAGDEIVVTAQKREQGLQDVPISVQVVGDQFVDDLAADDIADIAQFVPGLEVSAGSPTQPRFEIRGIRTSDFGVGTDPAVGVYVDGVYAARSGAAVVAFNDLERIEVLKGPQGTLFGRNAAAGAVSIITKKPTNEFEAEARARFGNFGKKRGEIMVNVPVGDTLALRVNGLYNERNGLFIDDATGEDLNRQENWSTRAALQWTPTDRTELRVTWLHDEVDQDARPLIGLVDVPETDVRAPFDGQDPFPAVPAIAADFLDPFTAPVLNDVVENSESRNLDEITLHASHDFGWGELTSLSSWRQFETGNRQEEDSTNILYLYFDTNNMEENEAWYTELKLNGETGPLNWLVGGSYYNEDANQVSETNAFTNSINTAAQSFAPLNIFNNLNTLFADNGFNGDVLGLPWRESMFNEGDYEAFAVYGDVIWSVTDRLNLTFGARYTRDEKTFQWLNGPREAPEFDALLAEAEAAGVPLDTGPFAAVSNAQLDLVFDLSGAEGVPCDNGVTVAEGVPCVLEDSWDNFSPRAVVDYKITDDVLAFFSFAKGYKAGGFNSVEVASRFDNEDVTSFEFGFKSAFPDQNLILNASGFYYTYDDKQSIRLVNIETSNVPVYLVETSDDQAWGADFQAIWSPIEILELFGNAQYLDATFKRRETRDGLDLAGEPTGEPLWSASLGARINSDIDWGGRISFQIAHAFDGPTRQNAESDFQGTTSSQAPFDTGTSQNRTDIRLSWISDDDRVELGMFANNVFDNRYAGGVRNIVADTFGVAGTTLTEPRLWGGDITVRF